MIIRGHVPDSVWVMENEDATNAQLSLAEPPPLIKSVRFVKAGGTSPAHSALTLPGQLIIGGVVSSMVIV
jgi:hypothetical protein